ncbi:PTS ascorbate transporter subunit IIC [Aerococcaceae bacterium NML130460]|nr:PTS ascorbate transporter subunit IIC [Aerococcaceae bacterium NML130460]
MEFLQGIIQFFSVNILQKPEFFVGLLVLIGYMLLKKPLHEVFAGFIKATVGYMILNVGAGGLVTTFRPILAALNVKFGLNAAVIDPYFGLAAVNKQMEAQLPDFVSAATTALLIGFLVNIVLVLFRKITKVRTLFITGHIMVQQATTISWIVLFLIPSLRNVWGIVTIGVLCGLYWAVSSNLTVEATQNLTGGAGFAIGHQQQFAVWLTDKVAGKIGDPNKGLDDIKLPKFLSIFHDNVVASATLMLVFFGSVLTILGPEILTDKEIVGNAVYNPAKQEFFMYIISTALMFSVYLVVLMTGVRMFVAELTNSFQGISSKLLPGSVPAVDCAATYGFGSPNAVLFGFVSGAIGQFITIGLMILFKNPVLIITGFVPVFFDNATIAVFANKRGGAKAAMILPFISGILQVVGGAIAVSILQLSGGHHGNIDFTTVWAAIPGLFSVTSVVGVVLIAIGFLAIPQLQFMKAKDKEKYYNAQVQDDVVNA